MADVPENFDWVTARLGCTPLGAFEDLMKLVHRDVDLAKHVISRVLEFQPNKEKLRFGVVLSTPQTKAVIGSRRFALNEKTGLIELYTIDQPSTDKDVFTPSWTFTPRLSDDNGERFLDANNGASYQLWQVSRIALEPLIFR